VRRRRSVRNVLFASNKLTNSSNLNVGTIHLNMIDMRSSFFNVTREGLSVRWETTSVAKAVRLKKASPPRRE